MSDKQEKDSKAAKTRLIESKDTLERLVAIAEASDDEFSATEEWIRRSVLSQPAVRQLRMATMEDLLASGQTPAEVKMAFLTDKKLTPLLANWKTKGDKGYIAFSNELRAARKTVDQDESNAALRGYKRILRLILAQATNAMTQATGAQVRPLLELASDTARAIAIMEGAIFQTPGQLASPLGGRPTKKGQFAPQQTGPLSPEEVDQEEGIPLDELKMDMANMMKNFEADDDAENPLAND